MLTDFHIFSLLEIVADIFGKIQFKNLQNIRICFLSIVVQMHAQNLLYLSVLAPNFGLAPHQLQRQKFCIHATLNESYSIYTGSVAVVHCGCIAFVYTVFCNVSTVQIQIQIPTTVVQKYKSKRLSKHGTTELVSKMNCEPTGAEVPDSGCG